MTETLRAKFAELEGWTEVFRNVVFDQDMTGLPPSYTGKPGGTVMRRAVPTCTTLDDAARIRKLLTPEQREKYSMRLYCLTHGMSPAFWCSRRYVAETALFKTLDATPAQHMECLAAVLFNEGVER